MKLFIRLAGAVVAVTLGAGAARAQAPEATPTPTPTEIATPAPSAPEAAPPPATPQVVPSELLPEATPTGVPVPPAAAPTPIPVAPAPAARVTDAPVVAVLQAPSENPFGSVAEVPAALPPKLAFSDAVANTAAYVSARVDATGRIMGVRSQRDPIPSLAGESQRSLARWTFDPARKGSQGVETWAAMRLDLAVEIDAPRSVQATLTPVLPATATPRPLPWPPDEAWLETRKGPPPDGGVPIETVDDPPMPKKTPWDADSYKGPFSAKFWIKVNSAGVLERAIPIQASDPVLIPYLRRAMSGWAFRPAQANGASADSWNELQLSGQVTYKVELKQIASLRRPLFGS